MDPRLRGDEVFARNRRIWMVMDSASAGMISSPDRLLFPRKREVNDRRKIPIQYRAADFCQEPLFLITTVSKGKAPAPSCEKNRTGENPRNSVHLPPDNFPFDQVNDLFGDIGCPVADPFEMTRQKIEIQ